MSMPRSFEPAEGVGFEPTETGYASTVFKTVTGQPPVQEKQASDVAKQPHHRAMSAHHPDRYHSATTIRPRRGGDQRVSCIPEGPAHATRVGSQVHSRLGAGSIGG